MEKDTPFILIIGHARHGKDHFAELLAERLGIKFSSSSMFVANEMIWPAWGKARYDDFDTFFQDRMNHRKTWADLISAYNSPDKTKTVTGMMAEGNDMYVGMRRIDEFNACMEQGLFDYIVWVDASKVRHPESSDSMELHKGLSNYIVDNNSTNDDGELNTDLSIDVERIADILEKRGYVFNKKEEAVTRTIDNRDDWRAAPDGSTKVLDHGFFRVVDVMGSDSSIAESARMSYGRGTKTVNKDAGLINYLVRNHHCYHPSMEVLTSDGWKRWDQCKNRETFMVPNPITRTMQAEALDLEVFDYDGPMFDFESNRMSYSVTPGHRMWFSKKNTKRDPDPFCIVPVESKPNFGYFDSLIGYNDQLQHMAPNQRWQFIGFYLGDGCYQSTNRISFHLKKERKIVFIKSLMDALDITYEVKPSSTHGLGGVLINVHTPEWLPDYVNLGARASHKTITNPISDLMPAAKLGLLDGLIKSDGSLSKSRKNQVQFHSASPMLVDLFVNLSAMMGVDAHHTGSNKCVTAYHKKSSRLESRKHYHNKSTHKGKVYCTTTSTGLLMVRGGPDKYAFVCGNTSPLEMGEIKFHMRLPIFVMRQLVRHRTANLNEYSGRYSVMVPLFYVPKHEQICYQHTVNKQMSGDPIRKSVAYEVQDLIADSANLMFQRYETLLTTYNVSRETARMILPLNTYTEVVFKMDVNNLLKLIRLRDDEHSQWEIRQYAHLMAEAVREHFPAVYAAFETMKNSVTLTELQLQALVEGDEHLEGLSKSESAQVERILVQY